MNVEVLITIKTNYVMFYIVHNEGLLQFGHLKTNFVNVKQIYLKMDNKIILSAYIIII